MRRRRSQPCRAMSPRTCASLTRTSVSFYSFFFFFFFNDTAPTEISPLPLHAALPISHEQPAAEPLLVGVEPVARGRLGDLPEQRLRVVLDQLAEQLIAGNLDKEARRAAREPPARSGTPTIPSLPTVATSTMLPSSSGVTSEMTPPSGK